MKKIRDIRILKNIKAFVSNEKYVVDTWAYRLIEKEVEEEKVLILSEIFFKGREPQGIFFLNWGDLFKDKKQVMKDIKEQLKNKDHIYVEDGKLKRKKE